MKPIAMLALLALATLAGSATAGSTRSAQRLALVEQHAAAPVHSVRLNQARSFETLGDEHLLVWSSPKRALLLQLDSFCSNISSAFNIVLDYNAPTLSARFDHVLVRDPGIGRGQKCQIVEIREVDVKALKAAEREARGAAKTS